MLLKSLELAKAHESILYRAVIVEWGERTGGERSGINSATSISVYKIWPQGVIGELCR